MFSCFIYRQIPRLHRRDDHKTLYRYQKILNHAHSNTLGKLKMTQADREANLDIGTQEDWTSAGPSLEEGEE